MSDLKALSDAATQGEWEELGSMPNCVYSTNSSIQQSNRHNSLLACALVNAYREGRLVETNLSPLEPKG